MTIFAPSLLQRAVAVGRCSACCSSSGFPASVTSLLATSQSPKPSHRRLKTPFAAATVRRSASSLSSSLLSSSAVAQQLDTTGPCRHVSTTAVFCCSSSGSSSSSSTATADGSRSYVPGSAVQEKFPIVQLPARSLWCLQYPLDVAKLPGGEYDDLIAQVKAARHYYQYPSLSAPQIGWNVQMFTLFDDRVYINPVNLDLEAWKAEAQQRQMDWVDYEELKMKELREKGLTGFAWEPCASSGFLMHYIERPLTVHIRALNERGEPVEATLDGMRGRMALHEMDHLFGVLFTRRVVDTDHVVPLEGFTKMSDWSDDYPSLEARSTFLYTIFTPPYHFTTDSVTDGNLLDRKFEDGIYPGCEHDRQLRIETAAMEAVQRQTWRAEKERQRQELQRQNGAEGTEREPPEALHHEEADELHSCRANLP